MRRDLGELGVAAILLLSGYAVNQAWIDQTGGWREIVAVVGGVVFVAMVVLLPVAIVRMAVRQRRFFVKRSP